MKLSALLLVLVKVYWLDDEGPPQYVIGTGQGLLNRWQRSTLECYQVWWQKTDTSKSLLYQGCG